MDDLPANKNPNGSSDWLLCSNVSKFVLIHFGLSPLFFLTANIIPHTDDSFHIVIPFPMISLKTLNWKGYALLNKMFIDFFMCFCPTLSFSVSRCGYFFFWNLSMKRLLNCFYIDSEHCKRCFPQAKHNNRNRKI